MGQILGRMPGLIAVFVMIAGLSVAEDLPPISAASDFAHPGHSVTPPRLVHSVDAEYTSAALEAQVEGTVVLQVVIGLNGLVTNASVLCPLPGGLDEKALAAVKKWRYTPGSMDTVEIPVLTTVDVIFRLPYQTKRPPPKPIPDAAPAAQLALAERYERERNFHEAAKHYRLCAAMADAACQYGLGRLLVDGPDINPTDYTQGVAWLELSKEHGNAKADTLLQTAAAKLSSVQVDWVAQVKPHLEPRRRH